MKKASPGVKENLPGRLRPYDIECKHNAARFKEFSVLIERAASVTVVVAAAIPILKLKSRLLSPEFKRLTSRCGELFMSSSFAARQSSRAYGARPLALFLSLLLLSAALPTGSLSETAQPASQSATDFSTTSGQEAAGALDSSQASTPDEATQARIAEAYGKLSLQGDQ